MGLTGTPGGVLLGGGSLPTPGAVGTPFPGDINRPGIKDPTAVPANTKEGEEGKETKRPKKGGQKGKGKDLKQVDDVAKRFGMDRETRGAFRRFLEEIKFMEGRGDFSFQELIRLAQEFLGLR